MKKIKKRLTILTVTAIMFVLSAVTAFSAMGLDADFEKEIAAFPESYKIYLRKLHEDYPLWKFEPFMTGLDWEEVIDNEHDDYALVYESTAARIFKSLDSDDYDYEDDYFYQKDSGFVAGSRVAVEYFMDPRNFLDKGGIFQFELLGFSDKCTVEMVDAVLEGSFMYKSKMVYLDSSGKTITDSMTYAQAMYNAGKIQGINPCFIASKILNEVGSDGSGSTSGQNSKYPGIYNFYNIGATDGAGAIERGLLWASGSGAGYTSYSRPWTSPYKSILGGAEFLAEDYISAGQFTGYLQRFNVNPDSDYHLYGHQYMSNLTGALSQGYSTYSSYKDMNKLNTNLTFSIPVFENMSDENGNGKLYGAESPIQYGTINILYTGVRKGPSVDHDRVTDASGDTIWLDRGQEIRIIGKTDTDAYYYPEILSEPYWYKIAFTYEGNDYTGYIPGDYIEVKTIVHVDKGVTDISFVKSKDVKNSIFYSDPTMVKVIDDNTVQFLKNGTVKLYLFDSYGHFEEILFKVGSYSSNYAKNLKITASENAVKAVVDKNSSASSYVFSIADTNGNYKALEPSEENGFTYTGLKSATPYTVFAQTGFGKYYFTKAISDTFITKPQKVGKLDFTRTASSTAKLMWEPVERASGYQVYAYNDETEKYTHVLNVPFGTNSCTLTAAQAAAENFVVRAYAKYGSDVSYGTPSDMVSLYERPAMPDDVKISAVTASGYTISWLGDSACDGYQIYVSAADEGEYTLYKETTATSVTISGLKGADIRNYKIRSFKGSGEARVYSAATVAVTAITTPSKPQNFNVAVGSNRVIASWNAVDGATEYNLLYRKVGGEIKTVTVKDTRYELKGLESLTDYQFAVSANVTYNGKTLTGSRTSAFNAKTRPSIPTGLTVVSAGTNYLDIKWSADKTHDAFKVYLLDEDDNVIGSKAVWDTKFKVSPLENETEYKIILRGYKKIDGKYISSENSETLVASTIDGKITGISVRATSSTADISWNEVESAAYYAVYLLENGKYVRKMNVTDNFCTLENLKDCTSNRIGIRAYFKSSAGNYYAEHTLYQFNTRPLSVEKIVQSNRTDTSYTLTWQASSALVNRYYVYRYNEDTEKYDLLGSTAKTTCNLKGFTPGTVQRYAVIAAVVSDSKVIVSSNHTYSYDCGTYLSKTENLRQTAATENALRIQWDEVEGATGYNVYYYEPLQKAYRLLGTTTATRATFRNLKSSTEYTFRVNAIKDIGYAKIPGYYSDELTATTK